MPILIHHRDGAATTECDFENEARLGTAETNDLRLPEGLGVSPRHALITRSQQFQVPVLIDLAGAEGETRVNGRRVVWLKTLRHHDRIQLGDVVVTFWELAIRGLSRSSPMVGRKCLVCYDDFRPGDRVISCPRCHTVHHRACWFCLSVCSYYGCFYPVLTAMERALHRRVRFEMLEEESETVKSQRACAASNPRDRVYFKAGEHAAFCPECDTPYHAQCWLGLKHCVVCDFDIHQLVQSILIPGLASEPVAQEFGVE